MEKNIKMVRGDTLSFGLQILDDDGNGVVLSSAFITAKKNFTDTRNAFQKSLGNGITSKGGGKYVVRVAPADTASLEPGNYFYDVQIAANGDKFTILYGTLELVQDVTEA